MFRKVSVLALMAALSAALLAGCSSAGQQDPAALTANRWSVTKYRDANGRLVAPTEPATRRAQGPSMEFTSDGKLSGFGSVNTFGASYKARNDGSITIGAIASTKMAGPIELMDQEDAFFAALSGTEEYRVENHGLTLLDSAGKLLIRAKPEKQVPLAGTTWVCTGYNNGQDAFVSVMKGTQIDALFQGGTLTGSSGVNKYVGSYEVDGNKMKIGSAVNTTTQSGSTDAMQQEQAYVAILGDVRSYKIDGDILTLYGSGGLRLATYLAAP